MPWKILAHFSIKDMPYFKSNDIKRMCSDTEYKTSTDTGQSYSSLPNPQPPPPPFGVISAKETKQRLSPTAKQHTPDCSLSCNNENWKAGISHTHTHGELSLQL